MSYQTFKQGAGETKFDPMGTLTKVLNEVAECVQFYADEIASSELDVHLNKDGTLTPKELNELDIDAGSKANLACYVTMKNLASNIAQLLPDEEESKGGYTVKVLELDKKTGKSRQIGISELPPEVMDAMKDIIKETGNEDEEN